MKIALVILAALAISFIAYSALKPGAEKIAGTVYYYPKANVYHVPGDDAFYFYNAGQKAWLKTSDLSKEQVAALGDQVSIPYSEPVWRNNQDERMLYSVSRFNRPALIQSKYLEDSIQSLPKKPVKKMTPETTPEEEEEQKPKKGLKKFLDKLFGGKSREE